MAEEKDEIPAKLLKALGAKGKRGYMMFAIKYM